MLFFALVALAAAAAALAGRLGLPGLGTWPARMRWGLAFGLVLIGLDHLGHPARYVAMIPPALPFPHEIALFTGLCEIAGAIGLLIPRLRGAAGFMLALYFVCVFPANIHNALTGGAGLEGLPAASWYYWARLPFQPLIIWWALAAAELIAWPRRSAEPRIA